jgi:hypothetical protein
LLSSGSATLLAYARIIEIESPKFTLENDLLSIGEHNFLIKAKDRCIGNIMLSFWHDKATIFRAQGVISTQIHKNAIDVHIDGNAYFNPLGQMTESSFSLTSDSFKGSLTTASIHPIQATLKASLNENTKEITKEIPGPLLISKTQTGKLQLNYNQELPVQSLAIQAPAIFLKSELNLKIEPTNNNAGCEHKDAIDLTNLVSKVGALNILNAESNK